MQMNKSFLTCAAILFLPWACSEDPGYPELAVQRELSALVVDQDDEIEIANGSGDYSIRVEDEEVASAEIFHEVVPAERHYIEDGELISVDTFRVDKIIARVSGLKIGETSVSVKDNKSLQETRIRVKVIPNNAYVTLEILDIRPSISTTNMEFLLGITKNVLFNARYITLLPERNKVYIFGDKRSLQNGDYLHEGSYQLDELQGDFSNALDIIVGGRGDSYSLQGQQSHLTLHGNLMFPEATPGKVYLHHDLTASHGHLFPDEDQIFIAFETTCRNAFYLKVSERVIF
jgi:hypothetical protein